MSLFDQLVRQAMQSVAAAGTAQPAVEKELLHHDILREMSQAGLLANLTFIGGTCLRACYGAPRLSEDLDFTGGASFDPCQLTDLGPTLEKTLLAKYGLPVQVSKPVREGGNVSTWKLRLQTRPATTHLPAQRIHIDICAIDSHRVRPSFLRNEYGVDMGTGGLVIQAESQEEILADKWVALAFRPNRVQYRDLWDILWLERRGIELPVPLLNQKLADRQREPGELLANLQERLADLIGNAFHARYFRQEMERFLPSGELHRATASSEFWPALMQNLGDQVEHFRRLGLA